MAERRPKGQGLERVLGTGALFSTAYGNVGSSIYYALGLVAVFALGMTPVVVIIAVLIIAATAATYAEATTMYPEAVKIVGAKESAGVIVIFSLGDVLRRVLLVWV